MRILKLCSKETRDVFVNLFLNLVGEKVFAWHSFYSFCPNSKLVGEELDSEISLCVPLLIFSVTILICYSYCDCKVLSVHCKWLRINVSASVIGCRFTGEVWICYNAIKIERKAT